MIGTLQQVFDDMEHGVYDFTDGGECIRHERSIFLGGVIMEEKFPYKIGQPVEIFFDGEWRKGKIVAGYRYMDGIVTIQLENGRRVWCGEARKELYRPLVD